MDPYEVLGVPADASPEEVRRAYLTLARRHHPDRHLGSSPARRAEAEQRMRDVNDAWAAIRDGRPPPPPPKGFRPFSEAEEPDPRDAPDVPYRPQERARPAATMAPAVLFAASLGLGVLAMVVQATSLLAVAGALFLLSCVGFLVVPLLALGRARRDEG